MKQVEYSGQGSLSKISEILEQEQPNRIFLVHGKSSYSCCGAQEILEPLLQSYQVTEFSDFLPNPTLEAIENAMGGLGDSDLVIAVGGGTALDIAKLANVFCAQPYDPRVYIHKDEKLATKGKPLVAIPTTSGSGSEATHFAVVYVDKKKYSVAHQEFLLPEYVILDSGLTESLPPPITASTGIDALAQAIESYWSVHSTKESQGYAKDAIGLVLDHLEMAVHSPTIEHREGMLKASNLAGKAINITKTTAPHALSYILTAHHRIPHGHAVGLTLGEVLLYNSKATSEDVADPRGIAYVHSTLHNVLNFLGCTSAEHARDFLQEFMQSIGLETRLHHLGVTHDDIPALVKGVNIERLGNNPRTITSEYLDDLYSNAIY